MRAKQNGLGFLEQALFPHFVMLKVGLKRGRLSTRTAGTPGRAVGWCLPREPLSPAGTGTARALQAGGERWDIGHSP